MKRLSSEQWDYILQQSRCYRKSAKQISDALGLNQQTIKNYLTVFEKVDNGEWDILETWILNGRITGQAVIWYCDSAGVECDSRIAKAMVSDQRRAPYKKQIEEMQKEREQKEREQQAVEAEQPSEDVQMLDEKRIETMISKLRDLTEGERKKIDEYRNDMLEMMLVFTDSLKVLTEQCAEIAVGVKALTETAARMETTQAKSYEDTGRCASAMIEGLQTRQESFDKVQACVKEGFASQANGVLADISKTMASIQLDVESLKKSKQKPTVPML